MTATSAAARARLRHALLTPSLCSSSNGLEPGYRLLVLRQFLVVLHFISEQTHEVVRQSEKVHAADLVARQRRLKRQRRLGYDSRLIKRQEPLAGLCG